jgi:hypothetical protein
MRAPAILATLTKLLVERELRHHLCRFEWAIRRRISAGDLCDEMYVNQPTSTGNLALHISNARWFAISSRSICQEYG